MGSLNCWGTSFRSCLFVIALVIAGFYAHRPLVDDAPMRSKIIITWNNEVTGNGRQWFGQSHPGPASEASTLLGCCCSLQESIVLIDIVPPAVTVEARKKKSSRAEAFGYSNLSSAGPQLLAARLEPKLKGLPSLIVDARIRPGFPPDGIVLGQLG